MHWRLLAPLTAFRENAQVSRIAPRPSYGSALVYFEARFSIQESDEGVTISLGFCEQCDGLALTVGPLQGAFLRDSGSAVQYPSISKLAAMSATGQRLRGKAPQILPVRDRKPRTLRCWRQQANGHFDGFSFFPPECVGDSQFVIEMIGTTQTDLNLLGLFCHRAINQFLNRASQCDRELSHGDSPGEERWKRRESTHGRDLNLSGIEQVATFAAGRQTGAVRTESPQASDSHRVDRL